MIIFPAIDIIDGRAVRLYKGDYAAMTVYSEDPCAVAEDFKAKGATHIHLVDLDGARTGGTPNLKTVSEIAKRGGLFIEVGGGIRDMAAVDRYIGEGVDRVIIGTAAVTDMNFLEEAVGRYGKAIAVGADIKDGFVAIRGWVEKSELTLDGLIAAVSAAGVKTLICTDISRDGAMRGANRALYGELAKKTGMDIVASGGVSTLDDVAALRALGLYGAIIGKAYYTGDIDLAKAIEVAR